MTTNLDNVPETDDEVDAILDAANVAEPTPAPPAEEPTPDTTPPAPAPVAPAPRTGNAAWPSEAEREVVGQFMDRLRLEGYTRPELSKFTGFNDSTVWRAQNRKVHIHEVEHWMKTVFEPFKDGTLPPAAKSLKTPKPEVLQARLDEAQAKIDAVEAKIHAAVDALSNPEVKTVKDLRALITDVAASLSA